MNAPADELADEEGSSTHCPAWQIWPEGHTAAAQSSTQVPFSQCVPAAQDTPKQPAGMHSPGPGSHSKPVAHGKHAQFGKQMPLSHT